MDVRCVTSIWKIKIDPNDIDMEDIYNIFFGTMTGVATTRYFDSYMMAHEHEEEERAVNHALHDNIHYFLPNKEIFTETEGG